jgi:hypothetical protein
MLIIIGCVGNLDDIDTLDDEDSTITGPFPSFSGDCLPVTPNVFSTTGIIVAGEQQNCDIVNLFIIEDDVEERATLNVTNLVTENQFANQIFGNNPDPSSSFRGSENGTVCYIRSR